MTGRRHRSNTELVAQGIANIASSLFGGICVTGTIARTATNVRAGATSPVSGMLHAVFLLLFILVAAPLAAYVPLAALAGVLAVVAWNMIERPAIIALVKSSRGEAVVMAVTFFLVIFRDLAEGIVIGFALGSLLFIHRMSNIMRIVPEQIERPVEGTDTDTVIYRLDGAFFFGAAATAGLLLDRIPDRHRNIVFDCGRLSMMDSSGAYVLAGTIRKASGNGVRTIIVAAAPELREMLLHQELHDCDLTFIAHMGDLQEAL
eukprot:gene15640-20725_t